MRNGTAKGRTGPTLPHFEVFCQVINRRPGQTIVSADVIRPAVPSSSATSPGKALARHSPVPASTPSSDARFWSLRSHQPNRCLVLSLRRLNPAPPLPFPCPSHPPPPPPPISPPSPPP